MCIRKILKKKWSDFGTNDELLSEISAITSSKWFWLSVEFAKAILRCLGHLLRMDESRMQSTILKESFSENEAHPSRRRPKNCWIQTIKKDLRERRITTKWDDLKLIAMKREILRSIVVHAEVAREDGMYNLTNEESDLFINELSKIPDKH